MGDDVGQARGGKSGVCLQGRPGEGAFRLLLQRNFGAEVMPQSGPDLGACFPIFTLHAHESLVYSPPTGWKPLGAPWATGEEVPSQL